MTTQNNSSAAHQKVSVLTWVLLVSVILNLFLVGVLAGGLPGVKHKSFKPMALSSNHGEYMVEWVVRYLNPQDAAAFRQVVELQATALKQSHEHVHQAIQDVANAFEQDQTDPAVLQSAVDHLNQAKSEVNDVVGKIVKDAYSKLSSDGRHRLAELTR